MPSILSQYDAVEFIAAKPFVYNGVPYQKGEDVPDAKSFGNLESMVRSRRLIPVVDSYKDAPFEFRHTVRERVLAYRKLGLTDEGPGPNIDEIKDAPKQQTADSEETHDEFDPANHTAKQVVAFVEAHPDQTLAVYASEESGRNRPSVKKKLDEILDNQAEEENKKENIDV